LVLVAYQLQAKAKVLFAWRISQENEPRHAGLEDKRVVAKSYDDPLADSIHGGNLATNHAAPQHGGAGCDTNRSKSTRDAPRVINDVADNSGHSATHRLDFG
jgi:hypothetical protein